MSEPSKCPACAVLVHAPDPILRVHEGRIWHNACLIRSLEAERDAVRALYEGLRPHVSDRSVLRGLCAFADQAIDGGYADPEHDEDCRNAMAWLKQAAGWKSEK